MPGRLDAVHVGHPDVHQYHVRAGLTDRGQCLDPGAGLGDDLDLRVGGADQREATADQGLVVGH
jgi:hypothetical protein